MTAHKIYGGALFAVAALLFASTFSTRYAIESLGGDVSTVFLPRAFLIVWMIFAAAVFVIGAQGRYKLDFPDVNWGRLTAISGVSLLTAAGMLTVGFLFATIPGLWIFTWIFGYRKPIQLTLFSIIFPITVWILFINVFELPLPKSPWFDTF